MKILVLLAVLSALASVDADEFYDYINEEGTQLVEEFLDDVLDIDPGWKYDVVNLDHPDSRPGNRKFHREVEDALVENLIPELCFLRSDNCTIYNSFVLDCNCVEEFEKLSPQCRTLPCDFVKHALEHGPEIVFDLFTARNIQEILEVINGELASLFESYDFCTCSGEFLKALFGCAKFFNGNILHSQMDSCDIPNLQLGLRNLDLDALNKFFNKLIGGMCEETSSGKCYNDLFSSVQHLAGLADNTLADSNYQRYYGENRWEYNRGTGRYGTVDPPLSEEETARFKNRMKKNKCNNLFRVIDTAIDEADHEFATNVGEDEDGWRSFFDGTQNIMSSLYCDRKCKTEIGENLYPCCLKDMLNNKKMFDHLEAFILSIYKTPDIDLWWDGFEHSLGNYYDHRWNYTIPEDLRTSFMKTIHPAKYCEARNPTCFN